MVHTIDKYAYPNIHILFMSLPHHSHKANTFSNIIILDSFTIFETYDLISCDYGHVPLHHPRELKERKRKKKTENKRKRILNQGK